MENNTETNNKNCNCGGHSFACAQGRRRHRMLAAIILVLLTFWLGFKLGEMKGMFRMMYGEHMMMYHGADGYRGGDWSDQGNEMEGTPTNTVPTTPATTPAPANQ